MKKILLTCLQAAVTVFLLWWIFRDPVKNQAMAAALKLANWGWLFAGVGAVGVACLLQTQRWNVLLRVQGISMGWWRTLRVYMVGMFFNLFLLGATGGDVIKIYYAMRETTSRKGAAFLSVLVDRMMGLLGLVVVAVVVVALRWDALMAKAPLELGALGLIMGGMLAAVVCGFFVDRFDLSSKLPERMPLHGKIVEFASAFSVYARSGRALSVTLGLSITAHLFNFLAFYCAARALHEFTGPTGLMDSFCVMPIIMTITALPISLSGVGVREALFEKLFGGLFGTEPAIAVMISVAGFLMIVFWGLVGGLTYLFYRPTGGLHLRELEQEVAAVEESIEHPK
jgi:uncharacterized protein (TIRG00374 family)